MVFEASAGWENAKPFVWLSYEPNPGDYDQGMREFKRGLRQPAPAFDPVAGRADRFKEAMDPQGFSFLCAMVGNTDAWLTKDQLFWLANADPDDLGPWVVAFYTALKATGNTIWVPQDYWELIMGDEDMIELEG